MSNAPKIDRRVVESRSRLRERFLEKSRATPSVADRDGQGTGPPNRHAMPRVPVGQTPTARGKWPVLDLGICPKITRESFQLRLYGACKNECRLTWSDLQALEQAEDVSDFHCVTGWSKMDIQWRGVRAATLLTLAEPDDNARFVVCHGADGYTTNLPFEELVKDDVLVVHSADGEPLAPQHGGPVRMITPQLYAWKGAKWICAIEVLCEDRLGFWERNGYSNTAYPWRNDRYDE